MTFARSWITAGRGDDYLEIGMGGLWKWNPLSAWWLDSYSLAYNRCQPSQSAFREGQGALLAASLYQSGALDYRASPGAAGAVGDVATGLSMRD